MENAWPLWALPFWTMGVPLIWAVYEKIRIPKLDSIPTNFGARPREASARPTVYA